MRRKGTRSPVSSSTAARTSRREEKASSSSDRGPRPAPGEVERIRELAAVLAEFDLSELEVSQGNASIRLRRTLDASNGLAFSGPGPGGPGGRASTWSPALLSPPPQSAPAAHTAPAAAVAEGTFITSPFVGTFYRSPGPDKPQFVDVGQTVKKGQVLCIIEAMKLMNEIESETEGVILEIMVENAQPVEYGQRLFRIDRGGRTG